MHSDELERARVENESLRLQLEMLRETNHELEALVSDWRCERDVLVASNNLRELELTQQVTAKKTQLDSVREEYLMLCDYMAKSTDDLEDQSDSDSDSTDGEDVTGWNDRGSLASTVPSNPDGDRSSTIQVCWSVAATLSSRASRVGASFMERRRSSRRGNQESNCEPRSPPKSTVF